MFKVKFKKKYKGKRQGVAILYAILLVSVVLTISLSLLNITYKQIIITATSRDSQTAHFNAWSGVDCILRANKAYKAGDGNGSDQSINPFGVFTISPPSIPTLSQSSSPGDVDFVCGEGTGKEINIAVDTPSGDVEPVGESAQGISGVYKLTGPGLNDACAIVKVVKVESGNYADFPKESIGEADQGFIMVISNGYNVLAPCDGGSNLRTVERQIRYKFLGSY